MLALWLADGGGPPSTTGSNCPPEEECQPTAVAGVSGTPAATPRAAGLGGAPGGDIEPPAVTASAVAIIEEPCGALLHAQNAHQRKPPASLAKMMTALVAIERAELSEVVQVDVSGFELAMSVDSTVMGLEPGQQLSMRDLLYGMLLTSGADAALTIAQHVGGGVPAFVELMNARAREMGLTDTRFTNPHGLDDPGMYTSALDMATLARELLRQPVLADAVRTRSYQPAWDGPALKNVNLLLDLYPGALGVKTGYTDAAGQAIVAAAERDGRRLLVSVLGSSDVYQDAIALLDWAFASTSLACSPAGQH